MILPLRFIFLFCMFALHGLRAQTDNVRPKSVPQSSNDTNAVKELLYAGSSCKNTNPDSSLQLFQSALALSEKIQYKIGQYRSLISLTALNYDIGANSNAMDYAFRSLSIAEELNNDVLKSDIYGWMGRIYWSQGNLIKSLESHVAALNLIDTTKNKAGYSIQLINVGVVHENLGNYSLAESFFSEALSCLKQLNDSDGIAEAHSYLAEVYYEMGIISSGSVKDSLLMKSIYFSDQYLTLVNGTRNGHLRADQYAISALCYLELGERMKAEDRINLAISSMSSITDVYNLRDAEHFIADYYEKIGASDKALIHYKLARKLDDSIANVASINKMSGLQFEMKQQNLDKIRKLEQEKADQEALIQENKQKLIRNSIIAVVLVLSVFLVVVLRQRNKISKAQKQSEELLLNILPAQVADELKEKGAAESRLFESVTVLFTDFKGFTTLSENLTPKELIEEIHECFSAFDLIMKKHGIEKIKTIGDAYMAAGGLPAPNTSHPSDVVKAALDIQKFMRDHKKQKETEGKLFFEIRIGIHTGPVVAGIVGVKKFAYDIWGDTVNIASRMETSGEVGQINISESTYELVKNEFSCTPRGKVAAKGKGEIEMYFVTNAASARPRT